MPWFDARAARIVFTLLLIGAGLGFIWLAWQTLLVFLFAIFFAYLVEPVVQFVGSRLKVGRGPAISLVYFLIAGSLAIAFLYLVPGVVHNTRKLFDTVPLLYHKIATGQIAWQLGAEHGWSNATRLRIQQFLIAHSDTIDRVATGVADRLARAGAFAWWVILIPILAVFFLKDGNKISQTAVEVFERRRQREFLEAVMNDIHLMLAHYIRAQLLLAGIAMVVYITALTLLHVSYGAVLGVIGGFLEFIPIMGPLFSALLMVGVALGTNFQHLLILVVFLGVWRCLQDYFNSPHIMGKRLELHPLVTIFGVIAGAEIAGIIGVYFSIPVMATVRIFFRRWHALANQRLAPSEASEPARISSEPKPEELWNA